MNLRDKLHRYRQVIAPLLALVSVSAVALGWMSLGTSHESVLDTAWIYNLDTGKLSKMPSAQAVPPITLDDGVGYRAFVYTCGSCEGDEREVAYLIKYVEGGAALATDGAADPTNISGEYVEMVASVEMARRGEWMPGGLYSKGKLVGEAQQNCPQDFQVCLP